MSELGTIQLPKGWAWKTIPDLVSDDGVFIDGDWVESKDQDPNGGVRLIQLADVGDGVYRDKSDRFMTKAKADELRCTYLKNGDVLIARMPDPLGRACIFPGDAKPSVTVVDVAIVRSGKGEFDHCWLASFVNAHEFRSAISGLQAGSTRKRISRGNLATIPLPVPPLPEQRRIVAEIEKQFTRLEAGVAALRRVQANLKRYRAAVLKAACEGRLVPTEVELHRQLKTKNSKLETGAQLLTRILTERRQNWQGRGQYKEPAAPDTGKLASLLDGWTQATVEQLTSLVATGATPLRGKSDFWNAGNIPWVTSGALNDDFVTEAFEFITPLAIQKTNAKLFPAGTLLVALYGEGKTRGKVSELKIEAATNQACAALLFGSANSAIRPYLKVFLQNNYEAVRLLASGGVQPNLSLSIMKNTVVPLPPLAEQTRIVAEVERRLSVVAELESVVRRDSISIGDFKLHEFGVWAVP